MSPLALVITLLAGVGVAQEPEDEPVEAVIPSIVHIEAHGGSTSPMLDLTCRRFEIACPSGARMGTRTGSGFLIGTPPVVLTNLHVVAGATQITVKTASGKVLVDSEAIDAISPVDFADLALIPLRTRSPGLSLAAAAPAPAELVWLVGAGGEDGPEVSSGEITGFVERAVGDGGQRRFMLTDASVVRGMSGGPAVNAAGEVIGVIVAGSKADDALAGQGLLVPWEAVSRALSPPAETPTWAATIELDDARRVTALPRNAFRLGLQIGDRIVSVAGQPTPTGDDARRALAQRTGTVIVQVAPDRSVIVP